MEDYGLHLDVKIEEVASQRQFARSGVISIVVHIVIALLLLFSPKLFPTKVIDLSMTGGKRNQPLIYLADAPIQPRPAPAAPPPVLSKKDLQQMRSELKLPTPPAPTPAPTPPAPTPTPPAPTPAPPRPLPTTPQAPVQTSAGNPNGLLPPAPTSAPPAATGEIKMSEVKAPEAPKLPVAPGSSVGQGGLEGTMRDIAKQRATGGGGGEIILPSAGGGRGGASSPGQIGGVQVLSDTQGVDFNPYLQRIVFTIRQNWISVMPEIARMGKRGTVKLQFEIQRDGVTGKVYLVSGSQSDPLDRAAFAAIVASSPFPPLPAEFKGPMVRLQLAFLYNVPLQ